MIVMEGAKPRLADVPDLSRFPFALQNLLGNLWTFHHLDLCPLPVLQSAGIIRAKRGSRLPMPASESGSSR